MEKFVVIGGNKLRGDVNIESAKNAVLPMMAGAILTSDEVVIKNCPKISDVLNMTLILNSVGVKTFFSENDLVINAKNVTGNAVPYFLMKELRSSIFMLGALLGRVKSAFVFSPGGCNLGNRPINYHVSALKELGIEFTEKDEKLLFNGTVKGGKVILPYPSVGTTENIILASVISNAVVCIENSSIEPEVIDLINFLSSMGAKIKVNDRTICIKGVNKLHGTKYKPISDRIEAGTFIISTLITRGNTTLHNVNCKNILPLTNKFQNNTCKIYPKDDIIQISDVGTIRKFNVITGPHPAFPTDLQSQVIALLAVTEGNSFVYDTVYSERFSHLIGYQSMGAKIRQKGSIAFIEGVNKLNGSLLYANDLRGGAGLTCLALYPFDKSEIYGVQHIDRGYLDFDKKLKSLGANVSRVSY